MRYFILLAALCASPAFAWNCPSGQAWSTEADACIDITSPKTTASSTSSSAATATSGSSAKATGGAANGGNGGAGGQGGAGGIATQKQQQTANGGAGGSASNAGNAQSITETSPRQAVMAWSAATNTTAPCERDQHAGIGAVIGGLSFGHSTRDHDCAREKIAADLYAHGNVLAAEMVYCAISEVKAALGADCLKILRASEPVAAPAQPLDAVTHEELREVEKRMTQHGVTK